MKLGKTEIALLKRAANHGLASPSFAVSFGLDGIYKRRAYGERERLAALKLEERGLVIQTSRHSATYYTGRQGYFNPCTDVGYRLTPEGEAARRLLKGEGA